MFYIQDYTSSFGTGSVCVRCMGYMSDVPAWLCYLCLSGRLHREVEGMIDLDHMSVVTCIRYKWLCVVTLLCVVLDNIFRFTGYWKSVSSDSSKSCCAHPAAMAETIIQHLVSVSSTPLSSVSATATAPAPACPGGPFSLD